MLTNLEKLCGNKWKVSDDGTNDSNKQERIGCMEIRGRYGAIYPQGYDGSLCVRIDSNIISQRVKRLGYPIRRSGDWETEFLIQPHQVDVAAEWIQAYKKRKISPEVRERLLKYGKKYAFKKSTIK